MSLKATIETTALETPVDVIHLRARRGGYTKSSRRPAFWILQISGRSRPRLPPERAPVLWKCAGLWWENL